MTKLKNHKIIKNVLLIIFLLLFSSLSFINSVHAATINTANLSSIGDCGTLLKYKGVPVIVSYVQYESNGVQYPAYCLDKTKPGAETKPYAVSVRDSINDVGLWRRVVNGYPYKSLSELGVANKEEAFTATKQAIYCYIHGNNPDDYEGIGEAGRRTLAAMKKIISDAENSTETKISNNVEIYKDGDKWKQDDIDKNYISKEYSIRHEGDIKNYTITLTNENKIDIGGIKLTDLKNNEKNTFSPNEKFKILIPIKNTDKSGSINIKVKTLMKTKPVLFGAAPDSNYQDYALTGETYEDSTGETTDYYTKNETKIIIAKKDKETAKPLKGVEFEILDKNKNVVYQGLKTDSNGKIIVENVVPGTYFIREVNSINGYDKYEDLIDIGLSMNEEYTVTVYNNKSEVPEIEIEKTENGKEVDNKEVEKEQNSNKKTVTQKTVSAQTKRLPVTGM